MIKLIGFIASIFILYIACAVNASADTVVLAMAILAAGFMTGEF